MKEEMEVVGSVRMSVMKSRRGMIDLRIRVKDGENVRWAAASATPDEVETLLKRHMCGVFQVAKGFIAVERNEKELKFAAKSLLPLEWETSNCEVGCETAMRTVDAAREFAKELDFALDDKFEAGFEEVYNGGASGW